MSGSLANLSRWWKLSLMSSRAKHIGQNQAVQICRVWSRGLSTSNTLGTDPWVTAKPRVCLHDVPTILQAGGLKPNSPVTLVASLTDENDKQYMSHAHYVCDKRGMIDVRVAAAVGGSYTGVFPMGLIASLTPAPHENTALRLYRRDTSLPWKIYVRVLEGHQPMVTEAEPLAEVVLERHLLAPGVRRIPIHHGRVRGVLYLPPGDGPFPGVVDMFGSIGGLMEFRSAMLASRGFASLAVAVFAYEDLPTTTDELHLDYFEEAVEFLLSQPGVVPDRCGVVAISKSGDIIFSMGTLLPKVKAVVSISGLTFAYHTRFMYKGKLYMEGCKYHTTSLDINDEGALYGSMEVLFSNDNPSMIPVEEADDDTHFLVAVGEDDSWGFKHSLPPFRERMLKNHKYNFETILYPGTGHIIEPPYGPLIRQSFQRHFPEQEKSEMTSRGIMMSWGGSPQPACEAQVDLWQRMRTFLMNHIRDESPWYQQYLTDHSKHTKADTPLSKL
ncbi:hypothetical protein Pmani_004358 [Petrolisthes manimaculis]|uniref:Uncharacterized protein n=1 Tax=Petrolisthes manimaculis TaxID=1843537 RepID=A0AAE1QGM4_9EUCA|nr:hypothetical protein Pmani_004358 [Petrolisthes manimaculis]